MASTWLLLHLTLAVIATGATIAIQSEKALFRKETCMFVDYVEKKIELGDIPCSNHSACNKHYRITYINLIPFVYSLNNTYWGIDEILLKCCGSCVKYTNIVLNNITELTTDIVKQSDFVFPILARPSTTKLYGSHYLPYIRVPSVIYVTKDHQGLFPSILNCYPIVVL